MFTTLDGGNNGTVCKGLIRTARELNFHSLPLGSTQAFPFNKSNPRLLAGRTPIIIIVVTVGVVSPGNQHCCGLRFGVSEYIGNPEVLFVRHYPSRLAVSVCNADT